MDMEKLNRIEALIREERDLRETMAEMSEQKERIRQYCLEALKDTDATARKVVEIVANNCGLFPTYDTAYGTIYYTVSNHERHFHVRVQKGQPWDHPDNMIDEMYIETVHGKSEQVFAADHLVPYPHGYRKFGKYEAAKKLIEGATDLQTLTQYQKQAEHAKRWATELLDILEGHMKNAVDTRNREMQDGVHAAAQEYRKIG